MFHDIPLRFMSAIKDGRLPITLDKERYLLFSLNVIDEIQDKFGAFDQLHEVLKGESSIKNLRWILTLLLNEGAASTQIANEKPIGEAEVLTERFVGLLIHAGNFTEIRTAIFKAFAIGNAGSEDPPETAYGSSIDKTEIGDAGDGDTVSGNTEVSGSEEDEAKNTEAGGDI